MIIQVLIPDTDCHAAIKLMSFVESDLPKSICILDVADQARLQEFARGINARIFGPEDGKAFDP